MYVRLAGGLGNQIFQAAFGLSRSQRRCEPVAFHPFALGKGSHRPYALSVFKYPFDIVESFEDNGGGLTYTEKSFSFDPDAEGRPRATYFIGNWQSEKYFEQQTVRDAFKITNVTEASQKWADVIGMGTSCSIHVRRSDYLNVQHYHGLIGREWYQDAIEYIKQRVSSVRFYVFSDDPTWCRSAFVGDEFRIVDANGMGDGESGPATEHEDLFLMASCTHAIIPNSSFGWWGAWLNPDKTRMVVAPKQWFTATGPAGRFDTSDLIPERWVRL